MLRCLLWSFLGWSWEVIVIRNLPKQLWRSPGVTSTALVQGWLRNWISGAISDWLGGYGGQYVDHFKAKIELSWEEHQLVVWSFDLLHECTRGRCVRWFAMLSLPMRGSFQPGDCVMPLALSQCCENSSPSETWAHAQQQTHLCRHELEK